MFLTQTDNLSSLNRPDRRLSSSLHRSKSTCLTKKFEKISSLTNDEFEGFRRKKIQLKKSKFQAHCNQSLSTHTTEKKWNKIVQLFNMPIVENQFYCERKFLRSGLVFYRLLAQQNMLSRYKVRINIPETFLEVEGQLIYIRTNKLTGFLESSPVLKQQYCPLIKEAVTNATQLIKAYPSKYKKYYDFQENFNAPFAIIKSAGEFDLDFQIEIETYKNFLERRSKPSSNSVIQRYVYPRNMKAGIIRICYERKQLGEKGQQFHALRFQNVDGVFRANVKNSQIFQTFKSQAIVNACEEKQYKVQCTKITNLKGLQKFLEPSRELIWFLEKSRKIRVKTIHIDFMCDLMDTPWLINMKRIDYESLKVLQINRSLSGSKTLHIAGSYGACKLCCCQYLKKDLRRLISNKMLKEFLNHLKKRMKVEEYSIYEFVKHVIKHSGSGYTNIQVCQDCYMIVSQQYRLMEAQKKMARICNISVEPPLVKFPKRSQTIPSKLKQWRLMLYFESISNLPGPMIGKQSQLMLQYKLGPRNLPEQSWKLPVNEKTVTRGSGRSGQVELSTKKLKIQHFYSQSFEISEFLRQAEIKIQLVLSQEQKVFAAGSSNIMASFCRLFEDDLCLRQTSCVLLFYSRGKYCEMNIKVGLVCDGFYEIPNNIGLRQWNKAYFPDANFTNSNPIPKEWMQAFGVANSYHLFHALEEQQQAEQKILSEMSNKNKQPRLKKTVRTRQSRRSLFSNY